MAIFHANSGFTLTGQREPERLTGSAISANLFEVLGVSPLLGHAFTDEHETSGRGQVALLSHGLWQRRFGGDPGIVGKTVALDGKPYTVVGVMPPKVRFPGMTGLVFGRFANQSAELWVPLELDGEARDVRRAHGWQVVARLKPSVAIMQAAAEMDALQQRLKAAIPDVDGTHTRLVPLREQGVANVRRGLWVLLGAVGFILLIACANVANLLLARGAARQKEIATRLALGAGRLRLIRQLLTESLLLAFAGAVLGTLVASWGVGVLMRGIGGNLGSSIPGWDDVGINFTVLGGTLLIALLTGLIFGLAPAWRGSLIELHTALKEGSRGTSSGRERYRLRNALVVTQIGLALTMLIAASLLIQSFARLQQVNPGFEPANVLLMQLDLPAQRYPTNQVRAAFFDRVLEQLRVLPGVEEAGMSRQVPFGGGGGNIGITIEGRSLNALSKAMTADLNPITQDYFSVLRIPLGKGRGLTGQDTRDSQPVTIINEAFARAYLPGEEPLGKRIGLPGPGGTNREFVVIGVVRDFKQWALDTEVRPNMFTPETQTPVGTDRTFMLRTRNDPQSLMNAAREVVRTLDPELPITRLQPMSDLLSSSVAQPRFQTLLLSLFAALALVLAVIGIYGVMAYGVSQRTQEIGIRMALGAQRWDVLSLVLRDGFKLAGFGIVIGLAGAFALTRLLTKLLYEIKPTDPLTFVGVSLALLLAALLASCGC